MKNLYISAFLATLIFTGCGSDSSSNTTDEHSHGKDERSLIFYSNVTNDHFAYSIEDKELINLNEATHDGEDISNFNLDAMKVGKPFIWLDDKGDTDESNDEQKIVMFNNNYSYSTDGDATYEDFYYLGHFHEEEENGETHYHLAAHTNDEFNVTSGGKFEALGRLNSYLSTQETLKTNINAKIIADDSTAAVCSFIEYEDHEEEKEYIYAMSTLGKLYVYNSDLSTLIDTVTVTDSCTSNNVGMSAVKDGVWVYSGDTKKIYEIDSHDAGVYHIHETTDLSDYIGDGKDATSMVSLIPVSEHEH